MSQMEITVFGILIRKIKMENKTMMKKKLSLPFTGIASFCKAPICEDVSKLEADVAIIGAPFDMSTQIRPGARYGPRGIREASAVYALAGAGYYDHEYDEHFLGGVRIVDCGDVDMIHMDPHRCLQNIYEDVLEIVPKGVLLVVLGGDHAISAPVVRAYKGKGPLHVVQFDAHLDFVEERHGVREGQNNPMRRMAEMDHVSGMTQIGIHGVGSSTRKDFDDARAYGSTIIGLREFRRLGIEGVLDKIPQGVSFYVTIDVDVLDASLAPGTGMATLGGLDYYELTDVLRGIATRGNVVGFDFVEVAPMYDPTGVTCQVGAGVIIDFLGAIFRHRKKTVPQSTSG